MNYSLSLREVQRAEPQGFPEDIFHCIPRLQSQYRHSHSPNNGSAAAVAKAAVTAVAANVDPAVAGEIIASVEDILASMLTHTCIHSH